jgi:hypothetical protein
MNRNYCLIGDIHSQYRPLWEALAYCQNNALIPVILGDVFDSRCDFSDSAGVYQLLKQAQKELGAIVLRSNHQDKLERYIRGNNVHVSPELARTIEDFAEAEIPLSEVGQWLETMPYGFCFRDDSNQEYRCSHAYFPSWLEVPDYPLFHMVFDVPKKAKSLMMYGPNSKEGKGRVFWWEHASERPWVRVAGHYHVVCSTENSLVLDAGCGGVKRSWFCEESPALVLWDCHRKELVEIRA